MDRREYDRNWKRKFRETEKGKKQNRISQWKVKKIVCEDWEILYDIYINTTHCDFCNVILTEDKNRKSTTRCLDHDHQSGEIRNILCNLCNVKRRDTPPFDKKEWMKKENKKRNLYYTSFGGRPNFDRNNNSLLKISMDVFN